MKQNITMEKKVYDKITCECGSEEFKDDGFSAKCVTCGKDLVVPEEDE